MIIILAVIIAKMHILIEVIHHNAGISKHTRALNINATTTTTTTTTTNNDDNDDIDNDNNNASTKHK